MSYARFGWDGSDVYVFRSTLQMECCGCWLRKRGEVAYFSTTAEILAHLDEHSAAGHTVCDDTLAELQADAEENDASIAAALIQAAAEGRKVYR